MFSLLIEKIKKSRIFYTARQIILFSGNISPIVYYSRDYITNRYFRWLLRFISLPYCIYKYFSYKEVPGRKGLAFTCIAKNESPYIEEWINFHHKQGVSHFFIYDNESTDNFRDVLKPYIESGLVTYRLIKGKCRQCDAYNMALANYGRKFKYMGFIDCDEFVFVRKLLMGGGGNLYDFIDSFMSEHKNAGGIAIHWLLFGSGGHETKPEGGVLENYTMCAEKDFRDNYYIKTICDPIKVLSYATAHNPLYRKGFYNLDEEGSIVEGLKAQEVHFDKVRINHYFSKSKEEYIKKKNRGVADNNKARTMDLFYALDKNDVKDTEILSRI